jgi:hypothetical protein
MSTFFNRDGLLITDKKIESEGFTLATSAVSTVLILKHSKWRGLLMGIGYMGLLFGGSMMGCGGLCIGILSGAEPGEWVGKSALIILNSLGALFLANTFGPFEYVVQLNTPGQVYHVYTTRDLIMANAAKDAVIAARSA